MSRALVLSGGGSVGIAWQSGLAAGLRRGGVDLGEADRIVGTSAGSAVGAQLALGRDPEEQVDRYRHGQPRPAAPAGPPMAERMARLMAVMAEDVDVAPEERRARIGRFALEADALDEAAFVALFAYLKGEPWPSRFVCTAVDAHSGAFQVWDESCQVELDRAVASSCAVPGLFAPVTIGGRRFVDGGMRSATNADLAVGFDRVLVVSVFDPSQLPAGDPRAARYLETTQAELATLADAGAQVELVAPDAAAASVLGVDLMDPRRALPAALEGLRQGEEVAERLRPRWS